MHDALELHRRVCLLRQQGQPAAADRLEQGQLAPIMQDLMSNGHLPGDRLQDLLHAEEARVRDVALLAELLAPLLQSILARPTENETSAPAANAGRKQPAPDRRQTAPEGIAGFIDDMLTQSAASRRR